jgi:membrane-associated phospholipid phosphatase
MPTRARQALMGAAFGVLLLVAIWYAAHYIGVVKRADASILSGFLELGRPRLDRITIRIASLCSPGSFVILAAMPVLVALFRGRPRVAITLALILLGANETTELLKPLLAAPHDPVVGHVVSDASWPSGHATAAMSLCMCWIIAAPSRLRPAVAAIMGAFAIAVCYSFLELGWHYPSDVLGGFLVAGTWTLVAVAALITYEAHRSGLAAGERSRSFSLRQALAPAALVIVAAIVLAGVIALARPHEVADYTRAHETFVVGAAAIAALAFALASGLALILRRPADPPAAAQR